MDHEKKLVNPCYARIGYKACWMLEPSSVVQGWFFLNILIEDIFDGSSNESLAGLHIFLGNLENSFTFPLMIGHARSGMHCLP